MSDLAGLLAALTPRAAPEPPDIDALTQAAHDAAYAMGRHEGELAGRAAAEAELAPVKAALAAATEALQAATQIDAAMLRPLFADLVRALCEAALAAELTRPQVPALLAEAALAAIGVAPAVLNAHPDTLALIAPHLPPGIASAADPTLPPGALAVTAPDVRLEADPRQRLSELLEHSL